MTSTNLDPQRLADLIKTGGETDLLELKEQWWDVDSKLGKGVFAKDILAMANALAPGESGFFVIGVRDRKAGGGIVVVDNSPTQEAIALVLDVYTNPVPRIRVGETKYLRKTLGVLEVLWSEFHPHYATRDVDTVLSSDAVYTRRAGTVGRLKPVEIERLIRAKEARLGMITERTPVTAGFVELPTPGSGDRISVRVTNTTEEPVTNINASVDMILTRYPDAPYRRPLIANLTLGPGETREFDCRTSDAGFYQNDGKELPYQGKIWSRWFDLRLRLIYRGRDGVFAEIVREASVG